MLDQLIPALAKIDLNLIKDSRASLINFENVNLFLSFTGSNEEGLKTTNQENQFAPDTNSTDSIPGRHQGKNIPTLSLKISSEPTTDAEPEIKTAVLPFNTGLYFNFDDPAFFDAGWWRGCPQFIDITSNVRFVPFTGLKHEFPSLEADGRTISIQSKSDYLSIRREYDSMEFSLKLNSKFSAQPLRSSSEEHDWSLKFIPSTRIIKLPLNNADIIVRYQKLCFSHLWWLVNHHQERGDEAYLILHKL